MRFTLYSITPNTKKQKNQCIAQNWQFILINMYVKLFTGDFNELFDD